MLTTIKTSLLPPFHPSLLPLPPSLLSSLITAPQTPNPQSPIPPLFLSALRVRIPVFVTEQHCPLDTEIDADDARSWHWIAFDRDLPVATLRLVPVTAIPVREGQKREDGWKAVVVMEKEHLGVSDREAAADAAVGGEGGRRTEPHHGATRMWDGREAYVKIGRMATLSSHRGRGIAQMLVEEAMEWAGDHAAELSHSDEIGKSRTALVGWEGLVLSHAQKSVQGWWAKMGFEVDEGLGVWWEEGIEHVGMWRRVQVGKLKEGG